jgi:predicted nucleic acid-binding protein
MIFVDTSAWLALADAKDENHDAARQFEAKLRKGDHGKLVTSDYILDETITIVRDRAGIAKARDLSRTLLDSPNVHLLWVGEHQFRESLELLFSHQYKHWSLTDCTSFVLMRGMEIGIAFTFDSDFGQAGFSALPSPGTRPSD